MDGSRPPKKTCSRPKKKISSELSPDTHIISLAGAGPPPPGRASPGPPPLRLHSAFGPAQRQRPPGSRTASAGTPAPLH